MEPRCGSGSGNALEIVFSVDLLMPADRPLLVAFVRVRNPDPEPKPLYWWTNIAAPEEPGVRVLAPADGAWRSGYDGSIALVDIPFADDPATDVSLPATREASRGLLLSGACRAASWIAAVRPTAVGSFRPPPLSCAVASCFVGVRRPAAGTGRCGWRARGSGYLEIQAGLATTQLEHLRLEGAPRSAGRRPTRRSKRLQGGTQFVAGRAG